MSYRPTRDEWLEHWMEEAEENRGEGEPESTWAEAMAAYAEMVQCRAEAYAEERAEARHCGWE